MNMFDDEESVAKRKKQKDQKEEAKQKYLQKLSQEEDMRKSRERLGLAGGDDKMWRTCYRDSYKPFKQQMY